MAEQSIVLWPLIVYFGTVLLVAGAMLGMSYLFGGRHRARTRDEPFESGIMPTGSARVRYDVKFYRVATFFVVFDLETVFLFAWAIAAREVGWSGYIEVLVFVIILVAGLVYLWRTGALAWGTRPYTLQKGATRLHPDETLEITATGREDKDSGKAYQQQIN